MKRTILICSLGLFHIACHAQNVKQTTTSDQPFQGIPAKQTQNTSTAAPTTAKTPSAAPVEEVMQKKENKQVHSGYIPTDLPSQSRVGTGIEKSAHNNRENKSK